MKEKKLEILRTAFYILFVATVASSKPVSLHGFQFRSMMADSLESSESSESSKSSSENGQPMVAGTEIAIPDTQEETDPPDSEAIASETAPEVDDALIASQTTLQTDASSADALNGTDTEATSQHPVINALTDSPSLTSDNVTTHIRSMVTTALPSITDTATIQTLYVSTTSPPGPYHIPIMEQPTPPPVSPIPSLTPQQLVPLGTTDDIAGVPGCFTVVYITSPHAQPVPVRGDNI